MKEIIASVGGRAPPHCPLGVGSQTPKGCKISRCLAQNLVALAKFTVLPLQGLHLLGHFARQTGPCATVDLRLLLVIEPTSHELGAPANPAVATPFSLLAKLETMARLERYGSITSDFTSYPFCPPGRTKNEQGRVAQWLPVRSTRGNIHQAN